MNASLVAFYGTTAKPPELQKLISHIQDVVEDARRLRFVRYEPEQVHALSFAAYEETTLAPDRTRQFSLDEIARDPQRLIALYAAAV